MVFTFRPLCVFAALMIVCAGPAQGREAGPGFSITDRLRIFPESAPVVLNLAAEGAPPAAVAVVRRGPGGDADAGERPVVWKDGRAVLDLGRLPRGYYELRSPGAAGPAAPPAIPASFVVTFDPAARPKVDPKNARIATDAAMAWLVPPADFDAVSRAMFLCGVAWVRDRMNWAEVNPARGEYRWVDKYDGAADAQVKAGLKVVTIFHCSAAWTRADGDIKAFPDDPRDGYAWGRALAERFQGRISAYEVWNEADISVFGDETADRYAPLLKATYLGIKAADPAAIVLMNSFALRSTPFGEVLGRNDISAYTDAWNHHLYVPYDEHPVVTRWHKEMASKARMSALPFWVTEAGIRVEDKGGRLSEEDRWKQAEFVAKSYALSLGSGIDRHFFFIFPYYLENGIDFGLLDKDLAPAPGAAAFSAMSYALGAAEPLGEGLHGTSPDVAARVFDAGPWKAAVVWRDAGPGTVEVKTADPAPRVLSVTGEEIPVDASGGVFRVTVGPSPVFLLVKDLAPASSRRVEEPVAMPPPPGLKEVIVRINLPRELARYRDNFYAFEPGATAEGSMEAWNLGTAPVKGVLRVEADEPYVVGPTKSPVEIPAGGTVKVPFTVKVPARGKQKICRVEARIVDGEGKASSYARLRVGLDPARIKYPVVEPLPLKPEAWAPGIPANGKMTLSAAENGALRVHSQFTAPGDRWAYPALAFRPPRDFSKFDALRLRLKPVHAPPDLMIRVQVVEPGGAAYYTVDGRRGFAGNTIDWVIPFDTLVHGDFSKPDPNGRLDLDQVDRILVGVNQTGDASSFDLLVLEAVGTDEKTGAAPDSRK